MKKKIFSLLFLLSLFMACQDKWEEYYVENPNAELEEGATKNLMEILRSDVNYSKFVSLLERTGIDKELEHDQILTVWVPTDASYPEEVINAMSDEELVTLCKNHVNYIALYNTKLKDEKVVKSLAAKNLVVKEPTVDEYSIDGKEITKLNLIGTNGVVHEIGGWLIHRKSIFEYVEELGDDYSIFRDSILSWSDTIFKPSLSFPLGVDDIGNTIYDSVFIIENSLLAGDADFRNEDDKFTLFVSKNEVINKMHDGMREYYADLSMGYTAKDSSKFFQWMMRSVIHEDIIENYAGHFESVFGYEWRSEFQLVEEQVEECSNGSVYKVSKIHVPKFMYLESVKIIPVIVFGMTTEEQKEHLTHNAGKATLWSVDGKEVLWVRDGNPKPHIFVEFNGFTRDLLGNEKSVVVPSGKYVVKASHRTYLAGNILLSINGEKVATYNAGHADYAWKAGLVSDEFIIKEEDAGKQIRIRMEDVGKKNRIVLQYILLEPSPDNY